jgi:hypothetical protein
MFVDAMVLRMRSEKERTEIMESLEGLEIENLLQIGRKERFVK